MADEALKGAEGMLEGAEDKMKAHYYYLKGQVITATANNALDKIEAGANAYIKVVELEKAAGASKYSDDATLKLQTLRQSIVEQAIADQNASKFKEASQKLFLSYNTNKQDTIYLYYAAGNAVNAKDYDTALEYYGILKSLKFKGIEEQFVATAKDNGEVVTFDSKAERDIAVKAGTHIKPELKKTPSRGAEIAKNMALIYINQGKQEDAMAAMEDAKRENPGDTALMQAEADMYYKMGNIAKYKEIMEEIVANDPENPDLLYNLGVSSSRLGDNEQAIGYYKKALELKPDYTSAQINIASIILEGQNKIIEKQNSLGTSSADFKKYDQLQAEKEALYKEAIPFLEGAIKTKPDNVQAVRTLMEIYYQLDDPKADAMKSKLKALEGGN